jgi:phospholipid/cholesterol/gamma-HCH transport system ATP-binding protein
MKEETAINVESLRTGFGDHIVHDRLDLKVRRGEVLGVVGGSGAGKSVLLHSIIGLKKPWSGSIEVLGQRVLELESQERSALEARWGVLFQDGALFSSLTVAQNIQVPLKEHLKLSQQLMDEIAMIKIGLVGLPPEAARLYPSELSGGMRKRAGLARALALDPEILFLDEPTSGLDPIGAARFDALIKRLRRTLNFTVFMVTHDLDSLNAICDRIAVLADKRVIAIGDMKQMINERHPWIVEYFHGPRARSAGL